MTGMRSGTVDIPTRKERFHPFRVRTEDLSPHRLADMLQDALLQHHKAVLAFWILSVIVGGAEDTPDSRPDLWLTP